MLDWKPENWMSGSSKASTRALWFKTWHSTMRAWTLLLRGYLLARNFLLRHLARDRSKTIWETTLSTLLLDPAEVDLRPAIEASFNCILRYPVQSEASLHTEKMQLLHALRRIFRYDIDDCKTGCYKFCSSTANQTHYGSKTGRRLGYFMHREAYCNQDSVCIHLGKQYLRWRMTQFLAFMRG